MASWLERMMQEFERASQQGSLQDQPGGDGQGPEPGWSEPSEQAPGASEMDPDRVARLDREPSPWELMADPVANQALWLEAKHSLESRRTGYLSTELNDNARGWLGESDGGGPAALSIPVGLLRESGVQNEPPAHPPLVPPAQPLGPGNPTSPQPFDGPPIDPEWLRAFLDQFGEAVRSSPWLPDWLRGGLGATTPTPTATATPTRLPAATATPSATATKTATPTPAPTRTPQRPLHPLPNATDADIWTAAQIVSGEVGPAKGFAGSEKKREEACRAVAWTMRNRLEVGEAYRNERDEIYFRGTPDKYSDIFNKDKYNAYSKYMPDPDPKTLDIVRQVFSASSRANDPTNGAIFFVDKGRFRTIRSSNSDAQALEARSQNGKGAMLSRTASFFCSVLLIALASVTSGCQAATREVTSPPAGHRGAIYYAYRKGVWKVKLPSLEATQLSSTGPDSPVFIKVSPNGRWLAYVDEPYDRQENRYLPRQLWLLSTEGGTPVLVSAAVSSLVNWWNDNRLLFFDYDGGRDRLPVAYDPETHIRSSAEEWKRFQCIVRFNPANPREALEDCGSGPSNADERGYLRVVNLDSRSPVTVTEPYVRTESQWSRDGKQVFFSEMPYQLFGIPKLFIWNREDGRLRQILGQVSSEGYDLDDLVWSPDGKWIAAHGKANDLCLVRVADGALTCMPHAISEVGIPDTWSPDSSALLLKTNRLGNWDPGSPPPFWDLFIVDIPSMKDTRVTDSSQIEMQECLYTWAP